MKLVPLLVGLLTTTLEFAASTEDCQWAMVTTYQDVENFCPGRYCGKVYQSGQLVRECGRCPLGKRSAVSVCEDCVSPLWEDHYSACYLVFICLTIPLVNWAVMLPLSPRKRIHLGLLSLCEAILCFLVTLLCFNPRGTLELYFCGVGGLRDWYSGGVDPPGLDCASEPMYPLWSFPLVFFAFVAGESITIHPILSRYFVSHDEAATASLYRFLWVLPLITVVHALFGGLIYFAFPYILTTSALSLDWLMLCKSGVGAVRGWNANTVIRYLIGAFSTASIAMYFDSSTVTTIVTAATIPASSYVLYFATDKYTNPQTWIDYSTE